VRVTTAFKRLLRLPGASVIDVSFGAVAVVVVVAAPSPASAELRTGTALLQIAAPVSEGRAFPGLRSVALRYEDSTGDVQVTAARRSASA
jgi:hypothetical protein